MNGRRDVSHEPLDPPLLELSFSGELIHWRGPSPYHFVAAPPPEAAALQAVARFVTYGWGAIPVTVRVGGSEWDTSLFPRDGTFLVPIKDVVRGRERLEPGDVVTLELELRSGPARRGVRSATVATGR